MIKQIVKTYLKKKHIKKKQKNKQTIKNKNNMSKTKQFVF